MDDRYLPGHGRFGMVSNEYNAGTRKGIRNDRPIIAQYGVNDQGSGDMYPKAGNMLHSIRHGMSNDEKFRQILRGLNSTFYHQTVTTPQIVQYISQKAGYDYSKVFDQYLRTTQIPNLEYYLTHEGDKTTAHYRWTNCIPGFNMPIVLGEGGAETKIVMIPKEHWKQIVLLPGMEKLFDAASIEKLYYITVNSK